MRSGFDSKSLGVKRADIPKFSNYQKDYYFRLYEARCRNLDIDPDNLVIGTHSWFINDDNLWYMINTNIAYDTILFIMNDLDDTTAWFKRRRDDAPFYGKSAVQLIQEDRSNCALIRFYANGLLAEYLNHWHNPLPIPAPTEEEIDYDDNNLVID